MDRSVGTPRPKITGRHKWHRGDRFYGDLLGAPEYKRVFLSGGGPGWAVRNNFIHECAVGISLLEAGGSALDARQAIESNLIMNCVEAGIRVTNAENAAVNAHIHGNLFVDARHALALGNGQGLEVDRNIVYSSSYNGVGPDDHQLTFLGLAAGEGMRIVHNTFVHRRGAFADQASWPATGVAFEYNIVEVEQDSKPPFNVGSNNLYHVRRASSTEAVNPERRVFVSDPSLPCPALGVGEPFFFLDPVGARPVQHAGQESFYPAPVSNAIAAPTGESGAKAPDLGTIEPGRRWEFPSPGPRWTSYDNVSNRPPWPRELDPYFAGLAPDVSPPLSKALAAAVAVAIQGSAEACPLDAQGVAVAAFIKSKWVGGYARATETVQGVSLVTADADIRKFAAKGQVLWEVRIAEMLDSKAFPETRVLVHPATSALGAACNAPSGMPATRVPGSSAAAPP